MYRRDRARLPAAERRRQIVEVTTHLIAERGFWGLSMQDVADGCGLTVPGLLHHVGSKDGLLLAVLDHRDEEDIRSVNEQAPASLRETCVALVRRNAAQPEIVRLFAVLEAESLTPDHPAHAYFNERQQRTVEMLAELAVDAQDPAALARQVVALMDGLQLQWLRYPETIDLVAEWELASAALFTP
ncbi:TetR/AcrR family transcriptional regulator [Actinoplanes sp. TRM 88003]|uniref:TetR/AcrR family transcriptional regulator n=1 Tax=Paractinoplanes aksuensis TaxID=2939490 RepID=A0ABT1DTR2_9ACTN|nr:TetR/AcrR family transcriptional regulator [Actinoplanes aksuensis]MCO8274246.1 TetR/AcrR family transcriptional regulator [Actinoplanes aksuensis]